MLIERRALVREALSAADAAALTAGLVTAYVVVGRGLGRDFSGFADYAWLLLLILPIWLVCLRAFGLYAPAACAPGGPPLARLLKAHCVAGLVLLAAMYLSQSASVSRLLMQLFLAVGLVFVAAERLVLGAWLGYAHRRRPERRRKLLLVAAPDAAERCLSLLAAHALPPADVVGALTPNGTADWPAGTILPPVLGTADDLPAALQGQTVDEVVVESALERATLERLVRCCAARGIVMRVMIEMPPPALGTWSANHFGQGAFMLSLTAVPHDAARLLLKRMLDLCGAAAGLCLCAVAYLWYGQRLRRETGGTVLFRQRRVGHNGRRFTLYKFRTMRARAEELKLGLTAHNEMRGPIFKLSNDPRVTPTGRRLRRRHLDELPQFFNVLRGEMSLVGTRPPTEDEVTVYDEHHHRRLSMKPGLTGLWQLSGNGAVRDFEDVVKLDCEYIDNWSLWLDLKIMARTMAKVMRGDGW